MPKNPIYPQLHVGLHAKLFSLLFQLDNRKKIALVQGVDSSIFTITFLNMGQQGSDPVDIVIVNPVLCLFVTFTPVFGLLNIPVFQSLKRQFDMPFGKFLEFFLGEHSVFITHE